MKKRFIAFLFCSLLIFAFVAAGSAQSAGTSADETVELTEKVEVTTKFDKAKNETQVGFLMMEIPNTGSQTILVSMSATYPGEKIKKQPDDVFFIFSIVSPGGYKYPDVMAMTIKTDGKKLPEVLMIRLSKERLKEDFLETIVTSMKFDIFKKISKAKTVEFQLENTKFQLSEVNIQKFAEVVGLLQVD